LVPWTRDGNVTTGNVNFDAGGGKSTGGAVGDHFASPIRQKTLKGDRAGPIAQLDRAAAF
jgi:hypothetical protein